MVTENCKKIEPVVVKLRSETKYTTFFEHGVHTMSIRKREQQTNICIIATCICNYSVLTSNTDMPSIHCLCNWSIPLWEQVAKWLSHSAVSKRSRVRIRVLPKVLGNDGIICKYLSLWVYPVFGICAWLRVRFHQSVVYRSTVSRNSAILT